MKQTSNNRPFILTVKAYTYISVTLVGLIIVLSIPYFKQFNNLLVDQLQGNLRAREEIVIIGIDDQSLQRLGAWPWNHEIFADFLDLVNKNKPRVVGIDVLFFERREGDEKLVRAIEQLDYPLVLGSKILDDTTFIKSSHKALSGFVNLIDDSDGKIRKVNAIKLVGETCVTSFGYQIFSSYLNLSVSDTECVQKQKPLAFNYTNAKFNYYSFYDIYTKKISANVLENKIVLIGATPVDLKYNLNDNFKDIFGKTTPGIVVHANIVNSFLQNKFQTELPPWLIYLILVFICLTLTFIYRKTKSSIVEFIVFLTTVVILNLTGILAYEFGINAPFTGTNVLLVVTYVFNIAYKYLTEKKERTFIQKAFGQYINATLLKKLMESPESLKLGGEKKEMTVLFSDIRGFTTVSETMSAEDLTCIINEYLEAMSTVILNNNGTIDKFIGDAIMAFWNAPLDDNNHKYNSVKTALEMVEQLEIFNNQHPKYKPFKIGIGINTGNMVVGNVGSNKRFDYTVLGDNVNLGSRIESLTKKYGISVLVTENVTGNFADIIFRLIDEVIVKGKSTAIKIYEPLRKNTANELLKTHYEQGFECYQRSQFAKAAEIFIKLSTDEPAKKMVERIKELGDIKDWLGVWKWDEK